MNVLIVLILTCFVESECQQFLKIMRPTPIEYHSRGTSTHPIKVFHKPANSHRYSTMHKLERHSSDSKPQDNLFLQTFVQNYRENFRYLKAADPCLFHPCGANTDCVINNSQNYRTCHCHHGFKPHPSISETCVRPCDLVDCGKNGHCINDAHGKFYDCICNPGFKPVLHGTSHFQGCIVPDPCSPNPCPGDTTNCQKITDTFFECSCKDDLVPINGNAKANGCGDVPDPCSSNPCPGDTTNCQKITDTFFECSCKDDLVPINGNAKANGCRDVPDPCSSNPCPGDRTTCHSITDTFFECSCKANSIPIDRDAKANGCRDDCSQIGNSATFDPVGTEMCVHLNCLSESNPAERITREAAITYCNELGSNLATFKDEEQFQLLKRYLWLKADSDCDAWAGIKRILDTTWSFEGNVQGPLPSDDFRYAWEHQNPREIEDVAIFNDDEDWFLDGLNTNFVFSYSPFCVSFVT